MLSSNTSISSVFRINNVSRHCQTLSPGGGLPQVGNHCRKRQIYSQTATGSLNKSLEIFSQSVIQSCPTLCDPKDCRLPGSSVHGILQARRLDWVAILSSQPRDQTQVFCIAGRFFIVWATREAIEMLRET